MEVCWKAFCAAKGYLAGSHTENLLISGELSSIFFDGEVREWLNRPVSKTVSPQGHGGSNPPLSAVSFLYWKGDRVAEGACLESKCRATYRGFESPPFRTSPMVSGSVVCGAW